MTPPHDLALDLLRHGYDALAVDRARHGGADTWRTRLLGRRTLVVRGRAGAELFYDQARVRRRDAVPPPLAALLFGSGAVHGLDGDEHAARKAVFLEVLRAERTQALVAQVGEELGRRLAGWTGARPLFDELVDVYGRCVLAWAGVPAGAREAGTVARDLAAVVDGFGFAGPAYAKAWAARVRRDRWAGDLVRRVREGRVVTAEDTALHAFALGGGRDLAPRVAGVELLNVLRPTVAVAWPACLAVAEVARHPGGLELFAGPGDGSGDGPGDALRWGAVHEARRLTPFVPALAGRLRTDVEHDGVRASAGDRIVLDVPGTGLDPRWWTDPEGFAPERYHGASPDPYAFVPQGGGDPATGHRCPGEPLTVALLRTTMERLADAGLAPRGEVLAPAAARGFGAGVDRGRIPPRPPGGCPVAHR